MSTLATDSTASTMRRIFGQSPYAPDTADTDHVTWMARAFCRGADPEMFFAELGGSYAGAKAICARCPVTTECLAWELEIERRRGCYIHGVYGGKSPQERAEILQRVRWTP